LLAERNLDYVFAQYDIDKMIVGHTPQENGIKRKFGGKVLCIDTGMSEAFGRKSKKTERIHFLEIMEDDNKKKIILK
jgi:hypothetical protein